MSKDILDKLELKNTENLSSNRMSDNPVRVMNRSLEDLRFGDGATNGEFVEDEFAIVEKNSYVELEDVIDDPGEGLSAKSDADISGIPFRIDTIH